MADTEERGRIAGSTAGREGRRQEQTGRDAAAQRRKLPVRTMSAWADAIAGVPGRLKAVGTQAPSVFIREEQGRH